MIRRLKAWLKKSGNTYAKLAELLGFKSRSTVANWIARNEVPVKHRKRVKEVLKW